VVFEEWAGVGVCQERLVSRINTYTEISPSGKGVKAIGRGKLNTDRRRTQPWKSTDSAIL
jgi:primase-polymerase (primpol)-like protein